MPLNYPATITLSALLASSAPAAITAGGATTSQGGVVYAPGAGLGVAGGGAGPTLDFFAADVASSPWYGSYVGYAGVYDPTSGKTFLAREAVSDAANNVRAAKVSTFNSQSAAYGSSYTAFVSGLFSDDHGVPEIALVDTTRFLFASGGSHGVALQCATSSTAADETTLTVRSPVVPPGTGALVMGYIAGTVMTVTSVVSGTLATGQSLVGVSGPWNSNGAPTITSLGTGTGGTGTYNLSTSANANTGTLGTSASPILIAATADGYSYPHTTFVSGVGYCFTRKMGGTYASGNGRMPYNLRTVTLDATGVPQWAATETLVIDFGDNSRCYAGNHILRNGEIYIPMTRADYGDTFRQDQLLFVYNPQTGAMRNVAGTFSTSSYPISLATANANFRVVNQNASGTYGGAPCIDFDAAGNLSLLYTDSASFNNVAELATPAPVYEIVWNGTAWSAPVQVGAVKQRYDSYEIAPFGTGMEALITQRGTYDFARCGDIYYNARAANGSWAGATKFYQDNAIYGIDRGTKIKNASAALRWMFGEQAQPPYQGNTGGASNLTSDGGILRTFGAGGSPLAIQPVPFSLRTDTSAWIARAVAQGGAQPSTAWQKAYDEVFRGLGLVNLTYDFVYLLAAHDRAFSLENLTQAAFRMQVINSPILVTGVGQSGAVAWKGDGVSGYLDTGFDPSQSGHAFGQNINWLAAGGLSSEQQTVPDISLDGTASASQGGVYLSLRSGSDYARYRACDGGPGLNVPNTNGATFVFGRRSSATARTCFLNVGEGDVDGTTSKTDNGPSIAAISAHLCVFRDASTYSSRTMDFMAGGGTSGISRTQIGMLRNVRRRYLTNIGVTVG